MSDMRNIREGFHILERTDDTRGDVSADHDIIWAGAESVDYHCWTEDDRARLENAGWHYDEEIERWSYYL